MYNPESEYMRHPSSRYHHHGPIHPMEEFYGPSNTLIKILVVGIGLGILLWRLL